MELERDVETYLVRKVEELGGLCMKYGVDGWPDRIVLLSGGLTIWCELKRWNGTLAPLQEHRMFELMKRDQIVRVVWSKQDVDDMLSEI